MPGTEPRANSSPRGVGLRLPPATLPTSVRVMHGYPAEQVMVIAADIADQRQWRCVTERVIERFGHIDTVMCGEAPALRASA